MLVQIGLNLCTPQAWRKARYSFHRLVVNSSTAFTSDLTLPFSAHSITSWQKPRHWVHTSPEFILNASFQKGYSSMQRENCSLHEVWWLLRTLDRCRELFNHMLKQMDTPITWFSWNIVALHCTCRSLVQTVVRLTEVMQLLKHLAEALQILQSCCQTIQY